MNEKIQIIVIVLTIAALIIIINMIRQKKLELRYALSWLVVGVGILALAGAPGLMEFLSEIMGIASPVNMLFFFGFVFSLMIIFILTVAVSRMSIRVKRLTQELALCRKEIEKVGEIQNGRK